MKKYTRFLIPLIAGTCVICLISVVLFTLPSFSKYFDLSKTSSIGDTIGGITAPIIGILSSVLLYLALIKQSEATNEQQLKNELEMVLFLFNQVSSEIKEFKTKKTVTRGRTQESHEKIEYGIQGIYDFATDARTMQAGPEVTFKEFFEAHLLLQIAISHNAAANFAQSSNLPQVLKDFFNSKLNAWGLKAALSEVCNAFEHRSDETLEDIKGIILYDRHI